MNYRDTFISRSPNWWQDIIAQPEKYFLVLTDDMDSYFSCKFLTDMTYGELEIGAFFDYNDGLYFSAKTKNDFDIGLKMPVFVDCGMVAKGYCTFNNHRVPQILKNHNEININCLNYVNNEMGNYSWKYPGSTYMMLHFLYNRRISTYSHAQKIELLSIDSFYIGYYKDSGKFSHVNKKWLERMGYLNDLAPILANKDQKFFHEFIIAENLDAKITIDKTGKLHTLYEDADLPKDRFEKIQSVKCVKNLDKEMLANLTEDQKQKIVTISEVYKDMFILSIKD